MHGLLAIRDLRYLRPLQFKLPAAPTRRIMACTASWHSLGTPRGELVLDNTLPTGQSFRSVLGHVSGSGCVYHRCCVHHTPWLLSFMRFPKPQYMSFAGGAGLAAACTQVS